MPRSTVAITLYATPPSMTQPAVLVLSAVLCQKNRSAVAIKTVSKSILTSKLLDNLESEIAILKSLDHGNITALKDIVVRPA